MMPTPKAIQDVILNWEESSIMQQLQRKYIIELKGKNSCRYSMEKLGICIILFTSARMESTLQHTCQNHHEA